MKKLSCNLLKYGSACLMGLLCVASSSYAAPLHSGFFVGAGIAYDNTGYRFTRSYSVPTDLPGSSQFVHHSQTRNRWQVPEIVVGYQHLFGRFYTGIKFTRGYRAQIFNTQSGVDAIAYSTESSTSVINYRYTTTARLSDPMGLDAMLGWAILPSTAVYAEAGLSYLKIYNGFTYSRGGTVYRPSGTRSYGYQPYDVDHINLHRIGLQFGAGVVTQITPHIQLRADYLLTNYGQMTYNASLDNRIDSHKQFTLRNQSVSFDVAYSFG